MSDSAASTVPYVPCTQRELDRIGFRMALFRRRGENADEAEQLAFRLLDRDRSLDTRRLCMECVHLQPPCQCHQPEAAPLREVLQRCPSFRWVTP